MELKSAWRFLNEDRICSSVYRSRKTPGVIAQCFDVFWIQWFILSGRLCVDESIRQGHGGTQCHIGPTVASRRLSVWGNYWGTHYFYCVLKAILIWSFWCCWHFFWTNRKLMQMFQTKKFRLARNATICGKLFLISLPPVTRRLSAKEIYAPLSASTPVKWCSYLHAACLILCLHRFVRHVQEIWCLKTQFALVIQRVQLRLKSIQSACVIFVHVCKKLLQRYLATHFYFCVLAQWLKYRF